MTYEEMQRLAQEASDCPASVRETLNEYSTWAGLKTDPNAAEWCYLFARHVLGGVFPEGESVIAGDSGYACVYARDIRQGPWAEGEPAIMQDAECAYYYARNVLRHRWPEAEPVIETVKEWAILYDSDVGEVPVGMDRPQLIGVEAFGKEGWRPVVEEQHRCPFGDSGICRGHDGDHVCGGFQDRKIVEGFHWVVCTRNIPARLVAEVGTDQLADTSVMPFGKYGPDKDDPRCMRNVPASYLNWLWREGKNDDQNCPVADYIRRNLTRLEQEFSLEPW